MVHSVNNAFHANNTVSVLSISDFFPYSENCIVFDVAAKLVRHAMNNGRGVTAWLFSTRVHTSHSV